jgi:O-antigen/teichoic acid export membrane protein
MSTLSQPTLSRSVFNVGSSWLNKLVAFAVSILITGLATNAFGLEGMGIWVIATNMAYYGYLMDLGIASALPRLLPRWRAAGDEKTVTQIVSTSIMVSTVVAVTGLVITPLVSKIIAGSFGYTVDQEMMLFWLLFIVLCTVFLSLPFRISFGFLASVHRFDIYFAIETIAALAKLVFASIVIFLFPKNMYSFGLVVSLVPLCASINQYMAGRRYFRPEKIRVRHFSWSALLLILSTSGAAMVVTLSSALLVQGSTLLSGKLDLASAAIFGYPVLIVINLMSLSATLGAVLTPVAGTLYGKGDIEAMARVTLQSVRAACTISSGLMLFTVIAGPRLLRLWLSGPLVAENSLTTMAGIMTTLVIGSTMLIPGAVVRGMLMAADYQWQAAIADIAGSAIGLAIGVALTLWTGMGLYGIACGMVTAFVLRGIVALPWLASKALKIRLFHFFSKGVIIPMSVGFVTLILTESLMNLFEATLNSYTEWIFTVLALSFWMIGSWIWVLDDNFRKRIKQRIVTIGQRTTS